MFKRALSGMIALLAFTGGAAATEPSFGAFSGRWVGQGKFQGAASSVEATFAPLYGGKFWTLDIAIDFTGRDGKLANFSGRGTYPVGAEGLRQGDWVDSMGNAYSTASKMDGNLLTVEWSAGSTNGRSIYRLDGQGSLQVEDFILSPDKTWRRFANAELRRQ